MLLRFFNDAHVHLLDGGDALAAVQLNDCHQRGGIRAPDRRVAARLPAGEWILQGNWDETKWSRRPLPTRESLDAGGREIQPARWGRYDGQQCSLQTRVPLERARYKRKQG